MLCKPLTQSQESVVSWISLLFTSVHREDTHGWVFYLLIFWLTCAFTREGASTLKTSWSLLVVGQGRTNVYVKPPVLVSSEWKLLWNTHTMHSPHHCGNSVTHARWRRNHDGWMETFTVFLTAFDFNTNASLTTTVAQTVTVSWACRSLGG